MDRQNMEDTTWTDKIWKTQHGPTKYGRHNMDRQNMEDTTWTDKIWKTQHGPTKYGRHNMDIRGVGVPTVQDCAVARVLVASRLPGSTPPLNYQPSTKDSLIFH
nr:hypothetical protein BgiMline_001249 [Biomphalaria glabrata]